jgi:hypothetical protein
MAHDGQAAGRRAAVAIARWALPLFALWLVATDTTKSLEVPVGAACSLLAATAAYAAARSGRVSVRFRRAWLARAVRAPQWVLRDSVVVLAASSRDALRGRRPGPGRLRPVPWDPGDDGPLGRGRRTLAYGVGSAGPNQYPIVSSRERQVLLVHELEPAGSVAAVDVVQEP